VTANICANWASTVDDAPLSGSRSDAPESPTVVDIRSPAVSTAPTSSAAPKPIANPTSDSARNAAGVTWSAASPGRAPSTAAGESSSVNSSRMPVRTFTGTFFAENTGATSSMPATRRASSTSAWGTPGARRSTGTGRGRCVGGAGAGQRTNDGRLR
jgi:hypothetical protein